MIRSQAQDSHSQIDWIQESGLKVMSNKMRGLLNTTSMDGSRTDQNWGEESSEKEKELRVEDPARSTQRKHL